MRDIKFRAWDKRNKSMCEVNYINFFKCQYTNVGYRRQFAGKTIDDNSLLDENMSGTCALMQYTGLKDKNSVEIYEGDIVKGFIPEIANEPERIGIVKWGSYSWIIDFELPKYAPGIGMAGFCSFHNYEVIGNIYENLELVKEE